MRIDHDGVDISAKTDCQGHFYNEMDRFRCLMRARMAAMDQEDVEAIERADREMVDRYLTPLAPMIIDLSGFSALSKELGLLAALASVQEVWDAIQPLVRRQEGLVLIDEADTFYSLFPDARVAVETAIEIEDILDRINDLIVEQRGPDTQILCASIGIGYGDIYLIGREDAFGLEVNFAYNAGENEAGKGEMLLTTAARIALEGNRPTGVEGYVEVQGSKGISSVDTYSYWRVIRSKPNRCSG